MIHELWLAVVPGHAEAIPEYTCKIEVFSISVEWSNGDPKNTTSKFTIFKGMTQMIWQICDSQSSSEMVDQGLSYWPLFMPVDGSKVYTQYLLWFEKQEIHYNF